MIDKIRRTNEEKWNPDCAENYEKWQKIASKVHLNITLNA